MTTPTLSICLASRNETAMLAVTVLSAVEAIKEAGVSAEIVVVENSDEEIHHAAMACLAGQIKEGVVRVIREPSPSIALAIDRAHREARGEFLFYTDAHTLIGHGTLPALLEFFARHEGKRIGFVYAPIQWAHASAATRRTHMNVARCHLGEWDGAACAVYEQKVPWKGMPYLVRREVWLAMNGLGCCAEHKLGWGVLAYIGIKAWMLGYENWAIPCGVVYHFGEWPDIVKPHANYRTYQISGHHPGLGKAVALYVFGGEEALREQFEACGLGRYFASVDQAVAECVRVGEKDREWVLARQVRTWRELHESPPWEHRREALISPRYKRMNQALHEDGSVKFGYKGADQAASVTHWMRVLGCADALDYGAGKQTLSQALKSRGIVVRDYDPCIPAIASPPMPADMVVCTDVLEHIEPDFLDTVLRHLHSLTRVALYARVCSVPCTSKTLPDGSDPHRIVQPMDWWLRRWAPYFETQEVTEQDERYFTVVLKPVRQTA